MLSQVLKPGTTRQDRQQILELIDNYSRYDPAEVAHFYDQVFDLFALLGAGLAPRSQARMPGTGAPAPAEGKLPSKGPPPAAGQLLAEADAAAWNLGWAARGRYMELRLGRTLHENFPVIDKIPNGIATSIKSVDLRAATYQNMTTLINRLSICVGEMSEFVGGQLGKDVIDLADIQGRAVEVAIPKGTMTPQQREIVEAVRTWAKTLRNPVELIIIEK
jgi:contact-dependent growth inhibition (CDI) system restriction endonuclease-like protein